MSLKIILCSSCRKSFRPEYEKDCLCNACHERKKLTDNTLLNKSTCTKCGKEKLTINFFGDKHTCRTCYRYFYEFGTYERKQKQETKIKEPISEKDRWLNKKPRKGGKSIRELNEISEYNRVYGKGAYDHYCKGRKWDKI